LIADYGQCGAVFVDATKLQRVLHGLRLELIIGESAFEARKKSFLLSLSR
jgi:hypothetical protein